MMVILEAGTCTAGPACDTVVGCVRFREGGMASEGFQRLEEAVKLMAEGSRRMEEAVKLMAEAIKVKSAKMEPSYGVASASALGEGIDTPQEISLDDGVELSPGVASASASSEGTNTAGESSIVNGVEPSLGVASGSASGEGIDTPQEISVDHGVELSPGVASASASGVRTDPSGEILYDAQAEPSSGMEDLQSFKLEESKVGVDATDICGDSPLHLAVQSGNVDMVKIMVAKGKVDVNAQEGIYGYTPLHLAIRSEKLDMVNFMVVEGKANVNAHDGAYGDTPLHLAVRSKKLDIIKFMVAEGKANVNAQDTSGETPLHLAARLEKREILKFMVTEGIANVNAQDKLGCTPLHWAVLSEKWDIVKFMVAEGRVDVNAQDGIYGYTPLHWAVRLGKLDMVKFMVAEGKANVNAHDKDGDTPLHLAVRSKQLDIVQFMVDEGKVYANVKDANGLSTEFRLAVLSREVDLVKIMVAMHLKFGNFDVNFVEAETGHTTLHCAILNGEEENIDLVRELLKCKEIMRLTDECMSGKTPLQIAHERGFKNIKKSLSECEGVQRFVDELYRDRQAYVDAANAILVGAALIASVTFASWLQPPIGIDTKLGYVDVQDEGGLQAFWIFNCLSFYFAIGTVVFGARSVLPKGHDFIKVTVEKLREDLLNTARMLACSVLCVIIAFAIAGCIVLPPTFVLKLYMVIPTTIGGLVCVVSIGSLSKSVLPDCFFGKNAT